MRIAVIGAGPSGLAALKELTEAGIEAVCFERSAGVGGVFRFDQNGQGVWSTCRLTSSATTTAFSDFPPRDTSPHQMMHDEYLEYLNDYVGHFGLSDRIHLSTSVDAVEQRPDGRWAVRVSAPNAVTQEHVFDRVACCVGLHQTPFIPPVIEGFSGPVHHSASYKGPEPYRGKNVLVIGAGESGADIIKDIADVAARCVLSLRRGVAVLPRQRNLLPTDYYTTRLFYSLPKWLARSIHPRGRVRRLRTLTVLLTLPIVLLLIPVGFAVEAWTRVRLGRRATPLKVIRENVRLMRESGGAVGDQFLTKSESFVHALVDGTCVRKGAVKAVNGREVTFSDGAREAFDEVMCCTGFEAELRLFPALRFDGLWKGCFSPNLGGGVGFIGLVRPAIGAIPPIAEMQARLFALVCAGRLILPTASAMRREIRTERAEKEAAFRLNVERMPYLVDYTAYMDDLARIIGCEPVLDELVHDPKLLYKFYCAHFMPAQYRLRGPGARPMSARRQIKGQIVAYPRIYLLFNLFYLGFSKAMYRLGAKSFRPHLSVQRSRSLPSRSPSGKNADEQALVA